MPPSAQDEAFLLTFLECTRAPSTAALTRLRDLAAAGATTSAFEDYELGARENFAIAAQHFLERGAGPDAETFLDAADVVMSRGPAFLTNRAYVGNGGAPAVHFVLGWLSGEQPWGAKAPTPPLHAFALLERMRRHGLSLREAFWTDFVSSLRSVDDAAWRRLQHTIIAWAEADGAFESSAREGERLFPVRWLHDPLRSLLRAERFDVVEAVLSAMARSASLRRTLAQPGRVDAMTEQWLNPFLSSKANRRSLLRLAARFEFVRAWLTRPAVLFALVRKKERSTLQWLLWRMPEAVLGARDEEGNSLLHVLSSVRGKTEGIAELFVHGGFDPLLRNAKGLSAIDIAAARRRGELARLLESLPSELRSEAER